MNAKRNADSIPYQTCYMALKKRCWMLSSALQNEHLVQPFHFISTRLSLVKLLLALNTIRKF